MPSYRDTPSRSDRATVIAAVGAIHVALLYLVISAHPDAVPLIERVRTQLVEIALPPPPPPPPPQPLNQTTKNKAGPAGKKAEPSPVVAPPPRIVVPAKSPLPAAPVVGKGNASTAGAATSGNGTGAGGNGNGRGGGGNGNGTLGSEAQLLSGGIVRRDYRQLQAFGFYGGGRADLSITVNPQGRVARCSVMRSTAPLGLSAALCSILQPRMTWAPARDTDGTAVTVVAHYVATWDLY